VWFVLRTGTKPSRAIYPCQQVAKANAGVWLAAYISPMVVAPLTAKKAPKKINKIQVILLALVVVAVGAGAVGYFVVLPNWGTTPESMNTVRFNLKPHVAISSPVSNIFAVNGTAGPDGGFAMLIDLMGANGLPFYRSDTVGKNKGPTGLIAKDDVVIIKVNSQWNERGGTNTDLVKKIIEAIGKHPDGWVGEVVVADNGQGSGGGSEAKSTFDYKLNNAENRNQSINMVVDSFPASIKASTYLWDRITETRVQEYSVGDARDGYVVNSTVDPHTGLCVSYPKFKTAYGTYISFKLGVWDQAKGAYDTSKLKVLNVPVLKTHMVYGVTASVKHYMGIPSETLTSALGASTHTAIGKGGIGELMAETRFPTLNILDCIWVNAYPTNAAATGTMGPITSYKAATRVNVIAASTDPVALDSWAAKNILMMKAPAGLDLRTMDPDVDLNINISFGHYLRLSMAEINREGHTTTMDVARISVHVSELGK